MTSLIGELDMVGALALTEHLDGLSSVTEMLDLRFVPRIDDIGLVAIEDAIERGTRRVIAPPHVRHVLAANAGSRGVELLDAPTQVHLQTAEFGVAVYDHELRFVFVNEALARIHRYPVQAHYGFAADELFQPDSLVAVDTMQRVVETRKIERPEFNTEIDGRPGRYRCYFGPVDVNGRNGLITAIEHADELSATASAIKFDSPNAPSRVSADGPDAEPVDLSERELEVLAALASGKSNAQIASDLFLSVDTVKTYCQRIYRKLGVENRTQATMRALRSGLLDP